MNHTVQIAISINGLVQDDQGQRIAAIILPFILLLLPLPALLFRPHRIRAYFDGWAADLRLMWLAVRLLLGEQKFHCS